MSNTIAAEIAQAGQRVTDGHPAEALARLAALLARHPAEAEPYRAAAQALFACVEQPGALDQVDPATRDALFRRMLLQPDCPARPLLLHEEVANRLASQSPAGVAALTAALEPTLRALSAPEPALPVLLFLLVVRSHLGWWLPQSRLSAWHRARFPDFGERDLALPYGAMFHPRAFGRNRDDLLDALARDGAAFVARLRPHHLVLLAWSNGGTLPLGPTALGARLAALAGEHPDESDRRATRSLALAGAAVPDALGLDEGTRAEAAALAASRAALASPDPRRAGGAVCRLSSRPWMASEVARSIAARHAPFLRRGDRRIKVAVCVSGQLRGFRAALPTWRASLFAQVEAHFFVHSWAAMGRGPAQPWRVVLPFSGARFTDAYRRLATQEGLESFEERYPSLFRALRTSGTVTADELAEAYRTPHVVVDDEADPRFVGWSNQQKMHGKIAVAHDLALASGQEFDLFVRLRPDLSLRTQAFAWADLKAAAAASPRLYADGAFGVHHGVPMIGDQFAVGGGPAMGRYAETASHYPALAALGLAGAPAELTGHLSLAQICWLHGIAVHRAPVRFGRLLEPEPFPTPAILAALRADADGRQDAVDRALIAAAKADLG